VVSKAGGHWYSFSVQCGRSAARRQARAGVSQRACACRPSPRSREQRIRLRHRAVPAQTDGALLWGMLRSVHDAEDIFRRPICAHGVPTPSSKPVVIAHLAVSSRRCAARTKASSNAPTSPPSSPPVATRAQAAGQAKRGLSVSAHLACGDGQPSGTSAASMLPRRHCVLLVFPRDVRLRRRQRRVLTQPSASV
jgi:hypothetical protein